ncbi:prominin-1-A-like [Saccostrea echinata]|uniref:prominin-1-A-like n=1 Tax=Saccostrea echinata TaxID=191078 RepID=UPI002A7EC86A|nr:prominin-1-A-like [Saccostrea echinata]
MKLCAFLFGFCIWIVCYCTQVAGNGGFTLAPSPSSPDYKADEAKYEDGGMAPLFNFARKFINMCLSDIKDVIQVIKDAIKGNIGQNVEDILHMVRDNFLGFSISVVVGLLFIVIFPIVGCCFCCCRLGCKACCAQPEEEDPNVSCKKAIYGTILFVFVAFTAAGNICVYVSNDRISLALTEIVDNVDTNLDDLKLFMDHTTKQIDLIRTNFQAAKNEIDKKLDTTKLSEALQNKAVSLLTGGAVQDLQTDIDHLTSAINNINSGTQSFRTACQALSPTCSVPTPSLPTVPNINIAGKATASIKSTIDNALSGSTATMNQAKTQLDNANTEIDDLVTNTKNAIQKGDAVNIKGTKEMVKDHSDFIKPYDKYRWYAGIGCAGVVSLILALYCCGLCCGCCGGRSVNDPLEKGCVSNCAGRLMIGSLVFIFVFCPLLMLITTTLYIPGALLERYICQPLTDPKLELIDELIDGFEYSLEGVLKHEQGHEMDLKTFFGNCQKNQAIYKALDIEHLTLFNFKFSTLEQKVQDIINEMRNKGSSGMGDMLTNTSKYGSANLLPTDLKTNLDNVKSQMQSFDLSVFDAALKNMENLVSTLEISNSGTSQLKDMKKAMEDMKTAKVELSKQKSNIPSAVDNVKKELNNATAVMKRDGMKNIAQSFINETVNIADIYFKDVKNKVHNEIGRCQPLWNLYNSIIKISLCEYIVDAFNGFWFSIGWCIFFLLPAAVIGTKLSNFLRDVEYVYDNKHDAESGKTKRTKRNQVGHKDDEE